ncbi:hypothetical protein [Burkholderia phage BCSR52]|uniref:Uncharacterized protein n=1 Tax=Burkholderia phage BCSR52 TaxID=2805748 RepID=A0A889IR65_9CAUD|nr:hypothetical protein [Burkholderia phage BCSR52]
MISHIGIRLTRQLTECELKDIVAYRAGVEISNVTRGPDHQVRVAFYSIFPRNGCNLQDLITLLESIK